VREQQSTSTILFHISGLGELLLIDDNNILSSSLCSCTWPQFLLLTLCRLPNTETSKHTLHPQFHTVLVRITQCNARLHGTTSQEKTGYGIMYYVVTALSQTTDEHTHDFNDCYSLWVDWVLRLTGEFWMTLKLHCAFPVSR